MWQTKRQLEATAQREANIVNTEIHDLVMSFAFEQRSHFSLTTQEQGSAVSHSSPFWKALRYRTFFT